MEVEVELRVHVTSKFVNPAFGMMEVGCSRYIITISCYSIPIQTLEEHFLMTIFLLVSWWWVVCSHSTAGMGRPIFSTLCNCSFYHIYCKHITVFLIPSRFFFFIFLIFFVRMCITMNMGGVSTSAHFVV